MNHIATNGLRDAPLDVSALSIMGVPVVAGDNGLNGNVFPGAATTADYVLRNTDGAGACLWEDDGLVGNVMPNPNTTAGYILSNTDGAGACAWIEETPVFHQIGSSSTTSLIPTLFTYELKVIKKPSLRYFITIRGSIVNGALINPSTYSSSFSLPSEVLTDYTVKEVPYQIASALTTDVPSSQVNPIEINITTGGVFSATGNWTHAQQASNAITMWDVTVELTKN
jgi:hypothetical protein